MSRKKAVSVAQDAVQEEQVVVEAQPAEVVAEVVSEAVDVVVEDTATDVASDAVAEVEAPVAVEVTGKFLTIQDAVAYLVKNPSGVVKKVLPNTGDASAAITTIGVQMVVQDRDIVVVSKVVSTGCPYIVTQSAPLGDFEDSDEKNWEVVV